MIIRTVPTLEFNRFSALSFDLDPIDFVAVASIDLWVFFQGSDETFFLYILNLDNSAADHVMKGFPINEKLPLSYHGPLLKPLRILQGSVAGDEVTPFREV